VTALDQLTERYKALVRRSWRFFSLSHRAWAKAMEQMGLSTSTFPVLEITVQLPGITQQQISDELSIDKSCTSRACSHLEKSGYICRKKSPDFTHGLRCFPTEEGKQVCQAIIDMETNHIRTLFQQTDSRPLEDAAALLQQLIDQLKNS